MFSSKEQANNQNALHSTPDQRPNEKHTDADADTDTGAGLGSRLSSGMV